MIFRIDIPIYAEELNRLQIPNNLPLDKFRDSGYTYRFTDHKKRAKEILSEMLTKDIVYDFRYLGNGLGVAVVATVDIKELT
jgi:hypothetical protein